MTGQEGEEVDEAKQAQYGQLRDDERLPLALARARAC